MRITILAFLVLLRSSAMRVADTAYPPDAGVINVTNPPAGFIAAIPDDGIDDTAAINALLSKYNNINALHNLASRSFYFPAGVYNITNTLAPVISNQTASSVALSGAGVGKTVFLLADNSPGFSNTNSPKPAILQGKQYVQGDPSAGGPGSAFGNIARNFSIRLGNNSGAVGILVNLANMGQVYNIDITASNAFAGLLTYDRCGAGLIRNISIAHCKYGICHWWDYDRHLYMDFPADSPSDGLVFEHINITDYKTSAIYDYGKYYIMRDVVINSSAAAGPAIDLGLFGDPAVAILIDLKISGTSTNPGIKLSDDGVLLFLRNADITGCSVPVELSSGSNITQTHINEFSTYAIQSKYRPGAALTLNLPVKEAPVYVPDAGDWTKTTMSTNNTDVENQIALQNDLNDCATPVLYIPYGQYSLTGTLSVSNASLKLVQGCFSYLIGAPVFEIYDADEALIIEDMVISPNQRYVQKMGKPLVFRNIGVGPRIENTAQGVGDIFIENIGAQPRISVSNGVHVYMRQLNREHKGVVNDGAVIWCLGDNIESMGDPCTIPWLTKNGGVSEILGAMFDTSTTASQAQYATNYLFEIEGDQSRFSAVGSGFFNPDLSSGWDLFIADKLGEQYLIESDGDYPIKTFSGYKWRRMFLPPFIVDRRNLAFYPFNDGKTNTTASLYHVGAVTPSSLVEVSEFGFVNKIFTNDVNGNSRNVNVSYLEDTNLPLDNFSTNYCEFSVTPQSGYNMDISGFSFNYAGENTYTAPFTMRFYVTTADATPHILGYASLTVGANTNQDWQTCWIDLSTNSAFQNVTGTQTFRMHFTGTVKSSKCTGYFDNVTLHGTCEKSPSYF